MYLPKKKLVSGATGLEVSQCPQAYLLTRRLKSLCRSLLLKGKTRVGSNTGIVFFATISGAFVGSFEMLNGGLSLSTGDLVASGGLTEPPRILVILLASDS